MLLQDVLRLLGPIELHIIACVSTAFIRHCADEILHKTRLDAECLLHGYFDF